MSLLAGLLIGLLERLVRHLVNGTVSIVGEVGRRLGPAYHAGYALVPGNSPTAGDVRSGERFVVSRDPISLPAWDGPDEVVRVRSVRGVQAQPRIRGWWWTADAAEIVEVLPYWVVLGPAGDLALQVIIMSLSLPPETVAAARTTVDEHKKRLVLFGDEWRVALDRQVRVATDALIDEHIAAPLRGDGSMTRTEEEIEELAREFRRQRPAWEGVADVTANAALAAALVDELSGAEIRLLSSDWERLLDADVDMEVAINDASAREGRLARAWQFIDRHPTIAAGATTVVLAPGLVVVPGPTIVAFLAALLATGSAAIRRRLIRGDRARRRKWRPQASVGTADADPAVMQHVLKSHLETPSWITVHRLDELLSRGPIWVGREGPAPVEPARTLEWESRTGESPQIAVRLVDGDRVAVVYTGENRHRSARLEPPIEWTTPMTLDAVIALVNDIGVDILIDAGHDKSVSLSVRHDRAEEPVRELAPP